MAISWGNWSGTGAARYGIDVSASGTSISLKIYIQSTINGLSTGSAAVSGALYRTISSTMVGTGVTQLGSYSMTGSRGSSYSFSITGTFPSHRVSVSIPTTVPSASAGPSISGVTSSSVNLSIPSSPSNGGSNIVEYHWRVGTNSGITVGVKESYSTVLSGTVGNLSPSTDYWAVVRARNSVGWSSWSTIVGPFKTLPPAPNGPSNLSVSRVSDTQQSLTWTRNATSASPYASQQIRRWQAGLGWVIVANVSGTATSFVDTTSVANRRYAYVVRAINASGSADSNQFDISTTPWTVIGLTAQRVGLRIDLKWTRQANHGGLQTIHIQDNPGGTGWVDVGQTGPLTDGWSHADPDIGVSHQYRVRVEAYGPTLYSVWSAASGAVDLAAAPLAPTPLAPASAQDLAANTVFSWRHNPTDTTDQEGFELRWRFNSGAWVVQTGGDEQALGVDLGGIRGVIEWQVRTRGVSPELGPWSAVSAFHLAPRPTYSIQPVDDPLEVSRLTVGLVYDAADMSAQAQWIVRLLLGSYVVESRSGSGSLSSLQFNAPLQDGETYRVEASARAGNGLWSDVDVALTTTSFPLPNEVSVSVVWADNGAAELTLVEAEGDVPVDTVDLYRSIDEAEWELVAQGLRSDSTLYDPIPSLGKPTYYRATSWTLLPSSRIGPVATLVPDAGERWVYFNYGPGLALVAKLWANVTLSASTVREHALYGFAGSVKPTALIGQQVSRSYGISGSITEGSTPTLEWDDLSFTAISGCLRDPDGRRIFGVVSQVQTGHVPGGGDRMVGGGRVLDTISISFVEAEL